MAFYKHTQFFLHSPMFYTSGWTEERELWALKGKCRKQDWHLLTHQKENLKVALSNIFYNNNPLLDNLYVTLSTSSAELYSDFKLSVLVFLPTAFWVSPIAPFLATTGSCFQ